jgi:hypothetical protein
MADATGEDIQGGLPEEEKRNNVIRLAFGGTNSSMVRQNSL